MARSKRARRRRSTAQQPKSDPREETVEQANARIAREHMGQPQITDEEIEAEVELEELDAQQEADALSDERPPVTAEEYDLDGARDALPEETMEERLYADGLGADPVPTNPYHERRQWPADLFPEESRVAIPTIDPDVFQKGPLAAGVQILDALLEEARSSYIASQIENLEGVLEETFDWDDRAVLTTVAAQLKNAAGLPDIATAYREMVARRQAQQ